jgi:DNA-binding response OmpR family regulator
MEAIATGRDIVHEIRKQLGGSKFTTTPKILIVENSFSTRKLMRSVLEFEGFEVIEAETGVEALAFAHWNSDVTVVLVDLNIPNGDAHFVLKEIEKMHTEREIKSCVLSSDDDDPTVDLCIKEGADDFVVKGLNFDILIHKLRTLLHASEGDHSFKSILSNLDGTLDGSTTSHVKICGISEVEIRVQSDEPIGEDIHMKLDCPFLNEVLDDEDYQFRVRTTNSKKFHGKYLIDCEIVGLPLAHANVLKAFTDQSSKM